MSVSDLQDSSSLLFKKWKILKIKDIVDLQNCLLCHSFLNGNLPTSFETFFQRCSDIHNAPTRFSKSESLYMPRFKSVKYGLNSITNACIQSWNKTIQILESPSSLALSEVKQEMSNYYMNNYWLTKTIFTIICWAWASILHCSLLSPSPSPVYLYFCYFFFAMIIFLELRLYPTQARKLATLILDIWYS